MTEIKCVVMDCVWNNGNGECTSEEIYVSDAETGNAECQYCDYRD